MFFRGAGKNALFHPENGRPLSKTMQSVPLDWPGRRFSRVVELDGLHWHIQQQGLGPLLLLVHGTGGSTHSWAGCVDKLSEFFTVLAIDLPGHGFTTGSPNGQEPQALYSLKGMARAVGALLRHLNASPQVVSGHSAGVPILMQLLIDRQITPDRFVGFNPAIVPPPQFYVSLLAPIIGAIVERDIVAQGGAWLARATALVDLMLRSTGSVLSAEQLQRYRWLCERPEHVQAALTMMSRWDLPQLLRDASTIRITLELIGGARDRWIPAQLIADVVARLPMARFASVDAGHLIPDERPELVVAALVGPTE